MALYSSSLRNQCKIRRARKRNANSVFEKRLDEIYNLNHNMWGRITKRSCGQKRVGAGTERCCFTSWHILAKTGRESSLEEMLYLQGGKKSSNISLFGITGMCQRYWSEKERKGTSNKVIHTLNHLIQRNRGLNIL